MHCQKPKAQRTSELSLRGLELSKNRLTNAQNGSTSMNMICDPMSTRRPRIKGILLDFVRPEK